MQFGNGTKDCVNIVVPKDFLDSAHVALSLALLKKLSRLMNCIFVSRLMDTKTVSCRNSIIPQGFQAKEFSGNLAFSVSARSRLNYLPRSAVKKRTCCNTYIEESPSFIASGTAPNSRKPAPLRMTASRKEIAGSVRWSFE